MDGYRRHLVASNNTRYLIEIQDLSLTPMLSHDPNFSQAIFEHILSTADGIILLYDITDENSYDSLTEHAYELTCPDREEVRSPGHVYPTRRKRLGGVLVGNKVDLVEAEGGGARRQVRKEKAKEWASMHAWKHFEIDTYRREAVEEVIEALLESIAKMERRSREYLETSVEERWRQDQKNMWGKKIEPWGEYVAVAERNEKKKRVSKSWAKVRDALPWFGSKNKLGSQRRDV
jgi:GTPase SAR1 family protein